MTMSGGGIDLLATAVLFLGDWTLNALVDIIGLAVLSLIAAMGLAFAYRTFSTRPLPIGSTILLGVGFVGIRLVLVGATQPTIIADTPLFHYGSSAYVLGVLTIGAFGAVVGRIIGDHIAVDVFNITTVDGNSEVASILRSAGLTRAVSLPDRIEDLDGHPHVDAATSKALAGREFSMPISLSASELEDRIEDRIKTDFDVGYVHLELDDWEVSYLAIAAEHDGLSSSLPSGTAAIAVDADPASRLAAREPIEIWTDTDDSTPVATGSFRTRNGDTATVVVDEATVSSFDPSDSYRLLTQPGTPDDIEEFATLLAESPQTVTALSVAEDGTLEGEFVDWLPTRPLVLDRDDEVIAFPADDETLVAGDVVYLLGSPADLHGLAAYERKRDRSEDRPEGDSTTRSATND